MYTKKCETCKKAITIKYKSDYLKRKDNWRFCSRDCRFFKSRSVRINCKKCDKSFKPRQIGRTKFCSKECQNDYFKNKNHHSWVATKYSTLHFIGGLLEIMETQINARRVKRLVVETKDSGIFIGQI